MRIRRLAIVGLWALTTIGLVPATAQAWECVEDTGNATVDDKIVGDTCWDCGYLEVRGKVIFNFPCGP
ncbi:MAG: hypothetical protein M3217_02555 [Actinomycetota bacterium]|nr:hypothetical protein [Actinomycetota bacterium]